MSKYLEIKLPMGTAFQEAVAEVLISHGQITATEAIIYQLRQWFEENKPIEPGDTIPDWWLGYRTAITHIQQIFEGENK